MSNTTRPDVTEDGRVVINSHVNIPLPSSGDDLFFTESGWVVIRFTEQQVHTQEPECIAYIKDVLNSINTYILFKAILF